MKIAVIADTHDKVDITRAAIQALQDQGALVFFHCGDLLSLPVLELFAGLPTYMVFGNNDKQRTLLLKEAAARGIQHLGDGGEVALERWRVAITHGHLKSEVQKLLRAQPDVLLLGHSHRQRDETREGTWVINPGALHRATVKTCAVLDLQQRRATFISL